MNNWTLISLCYIMSDQGFTIIYTFISVLLVACFCYLIYYSRKKGENMATKEDIKDITKQIEAVKSEVHYYSQRRVEKERCLSDIAYYSNLIGNMDHRLFCNLTYHTNRNRIDAFLDDVDKYFSRFLALRNKSAVLMNDDEDLINSIESMTKTMSKYVGALCAKAANAGQILDICSDMKSCIDFSGADHDVYKEYLEEVMSKRDELRDLQDKPVEFKSELLDNYNDYLIKLRKYLNSKAKFESRSN